MIIYHSTDNRKDIERIRDDIKIKGRVSYQDGKMMFIIFNPNLRITTNSDGIHILWISERRC